METESLFERLQDYLKRHSADERRTVFLDGTAVASALSGALEERMPGTPWYEDQFQRGMVTNEYGESLVILAARERLDSECRCAVHITLTIQGLEDAAFAGTCDDWWSWWASRVDLPELVVT